jgi:hypothetical protein
VLSTFPFASKNCSSSSLLMCVRMRMIFMLRKYSRMRNVRMIQSVHLKMKRLFFVFVPIFFSCYRELKVCTI